VVAFESSVFAQGLPVPANRQAADAMVRAVEAASVLPAVTAVVAGQPAVGLTADELERFLRRDGAQKVSARDVGPAMVRGLDGATTVAGALAILAQTNIGVLATGGIGGVHRDAPYDESADLVELARQPKVVVCAGAKSVLDLAATLERLESLGVLVIGYRTREFPAFYCATSGLGLDWTCTSAREIAAMVRAHRALGRREAVLVVQPPPTDHALPAEAMEQAVVTALREARALGIRGAATTPFLLAAVERATDGRSLRTNIALLERNAALAAEIAACLTS
jgi:pseudouridine-5'-phosphate glycosidase